MPAQQVYPNPVKHNYHDGSGLAQPFSSLQSQGTDHIPQHTLSGGFSSGAWNIPPICFVGGYRSNNYYTLEKNITVHERQGTCREQPSTPGANSLTAATTTVDFQRSLTSISCDCQMWSSDGAASHHLGCPAAKVGQDSSPQRHLNPGVGPLPMTSWEPGVHIDPLAFPPLPSWYLDRVTGINEKSANTISQLASQLYYALGSKAAL